MKKLDFTNKNFTLKELKVEKKEIIKVRVYINDELAFMYDKTESSNKDGLMNIVLNEVYSSSMQKLRSWLNSIKK